MQSAIGKNIRAFRKKNNLKVKDIALSIGISEVSIFKIEKGERIGNHFIKYLQYLKSKGADLNGIFPDL